MASPVAVPMTAAMSSPSMTASRVNPVPLRNCWSLSTAGIWVMVRLGRGM